MMDWIWRAAWRRREQTGIMDEIGVNRFGVLGIEKQKRQRMSWEHRYTHFWRMVGLFTNTTFVCIRLRTLMGRKYTEMRYTL